MVMLAELNFPSSVPILCPIATEGLNVKKKKARGRSDAEKEKEK